MRRLFSLLYSTRAYELLSRRELARAYYQIGSMMFIASTFLLIYYLSDPASLAENPATVGMVGALIGFVVVTLFLTRIGRVEWAGAMLSTALLGIVYLTFLNSASITEGLAAVMALSIVAGGMFNGTIGAALTTFAALFIVFAGIGLQQDGMTSIIATLITLTMLGIVVWYFSRYARASREEGHSSAIREQVQLANITTQIARRASERATLDDVLNELLELILQNFSQIYHAQVFLLDADGLQSNLVASTGETGKKLLERRHSLAVGSLSVIGQATLKGEPIIAVAGDPEGIHRPNDLLPDTTLEAAFPLMVGETAIGALDLQSRNRRSLNETEITTFQLLAESLGLVVDNVRQHNLIAEQTAQNTPAPNAGGVTNRTAANAVSRDLLRALLQEEAGHNELMIDFATGDMEMSDVRTATMDEAMRSGESIYDNNAVTVPLTLRGEVIGAVELVVPDTRLIDDDLSTIKEIGERFSIAVENLLVLKNSQRIARRESLINDIGSRLQTSNDIDATLAEAARSLYEALKADKVNIRLGVPASTSANGSANGKDSV